MRRKVMTNLKTAISFAQSRGPVAQNVARGVKIKADDRTEIGPLREGVDFPSRAELKAMIENSTAAGAPSSSPRSSPVCVQANSAASHGQM